MSKETEMENFLDDFLDYMEKSSKYEIVEKIDHKKAVIEEAETKGFKFQILVMNDEQGGKYE